MYINHNQMATNVANTLTSHYGNLATSTQRLSSGLRVNSAADDAAGLAIRELMRADIAGLDQGIRNANDGISLIQTADGALGIIDEKLIRMKELAEQAATGTYDSTQRLMIDSEYQQMASEITRIANATDFNGIKLLDGTLKGEHDGSKMTAEGAMKIHFGTGNDSAEDYYYIEIDDMTAQSLGLGNASGWDDTQKRGISEFKSSLMNEINKREDISETDRAAMLAAVDKMTEKVGQAITDSMDPMTAYDLITMSDDPDAEPNGDTGFLKAGKNWVGNERLLNDFMQAGAAANQVAVDKAAEDMINDFNTEIAKTTPDTAVTGVTEWTDLQDAITNAVKGVTDKVETPAATGYIDNTTIDALDADGLKQLGSNLADETIAAVETAAGITLSDEAKNAIKKKITDEWATAQAAATVGAIDATARGAFADALEAGITAANTAAGEAIFDATAEKIIDTVVKPAGPKTAEDVYNLAYDEEKAGGGTDADAAAAGDNAVKDFEKDRTDAMNAFMDTLSTSDKEKLNYYIGGAVTYNLAHKDDTSTPAQFGLGIDDLDFAVTAGVSTDGVDAANEILDNALNAMWNETKDRDFAGFSIDTQENAQQALNAINDAIVQKDKTRAHLGALQNRLENTVSNLTVQSENLQAAESRISDVDVATEMTNFVRNQILTQSAVAMLSQANSMPQMAMQLIH